MRYYFLAACLLLGVLHVAAKGRTDSSASSNIMAVVAKPVVTWFEVNGQDYYLVSKCRPGSDVEFYSERWGGKMLKKVTLDGNGSYLVRGDNKFKPAFALSRGTKNRNGVAGTGMVGFTGPKEFALKELSCVGTGGSANVYWEGVTYGNAPVVFEVLKSEHLGAYTVACTFKASNAGAGRYFSFEDNNVDVDVRYSIKVVNTKEGDRYVTAPLSISNNATTAINVFPTETTGPLNIVVPENNAATTYHITDMQGKIVRSGSLGKGKNALSISNVKPGNYIVYMQNSMPVKIVRD